MLIKAESFLKCQSDSVLKVASLIKHRFSFLNDSKSTILVLRMSLSLCLNMLFSINFYSNRILYSLVLIKSSMKFLGYLTVFLRINSGYNF